MTFSPPRHSLPLRLGTRSARYLPILGDSDRVRFFRAAGEAARQRGWDTDISDQRLERGAWRNYLTGLDVAVGTEAGSWYTTPSDALVCLILDDARATAGGLSIRVDGRLRRLTRRLPWHWRQWLRTNVASKAIRSDLDTLAALDEAYVFSKYFDAGRRAPAYMKAASSRHLEAAALGTPQLLLHGRYNDILIADEDYVAVSPDFSDIEQALDTLSDPHIRRGIAEKARATVEDQHTFGHRIELILNALM